MESEAYHAALVALDWQVALGADEAIGDTPVNRYAEAQARAPSPRGRATRDVDPSEPGSSSCSRRIREPRVDTDTRRWPPRGRPDSCRPTSRCAYPPTPVHP